MIKGYNQKNNKKILVKDNHLKLNFVLPEDISENAKNELLEVLKGTKFNRISIPVSTYRYYVDKNVNSDDNRVVTIGYIKNYNAEKGEFTVVVFNNNCEAICEFANPALEIVFSEYNGKLGCITKFNVIDMPADDCAACDVPAAENADVQAVVAETTALLLSQKFKAES